VLFLWVSDNQEKGITPLYINISLQTTGKDPSQRRQPPFPGLFRLVLGMRCQEAPPLNIPGGLNRVAALRPDICYLSFPLKLKIIF